MDVIDPIDARREALGAFVHEVRTPLTSIRMVLEIARRMGGDGNLVLDSELAGMLEISLTDLQQLTDGLQELSRLERGRANVKAARGNLGRVFDRVRAGSEIELRAEPGEPPTDALEGEWDEEQLATAVLGMVEAANRCGAGDGRVRIGGRAVDAGVEIEVMSGTPGGTSRPINADLGYGFFRGCALVAAMSGTVAAQREDGYFAARAWLPAGDVS